MGYLRLSLVLAVVYYHLADRVLAGSVAVSGFFALSGYLITLVSHEIYHNGWRGRMYFLANRIARIWPTYLACLGIAVLCMWATGFTTSLYHVEFRLPESAMNWLKQFTILGLSDFSGARAHERILPPAWSLSTELFYYLMIGLVTGASRALTTAAFAISAALFAFALQQGYPYRYFYFSIQGPAMIFYLGAMFYHWRHLLDGFLIRKTWLLILLANIVLYLPDLAGMPRRYAPLLAITSFYMAYVIRCLHALSLERKPPPHEQLLADMSYPMFLIHWSAGALVCYYVMGHYQRDLSVFLLALPLTMLMAAVIVYGVEVPVKRLRQRLRRDAQEDLRPSMGHSAPVAARESQKAR